LPARHAFCHLLRLPNSSRCNRGSNRARSGPSSPACSWNGNLRDLCRILSFSVGATQSMERFATSICLYWVLTRRQPHRAMWSTVPTRSGRSAAVWLPVWLYRQQEERALAAPRRRRPQPHHSAKIGKGIARAAPNGAALWYAPVSDRLCDQVGRDVRQCDGALIKDCEASLFLTAQIKSILEDNIPLRLRLGGV
jgi:hypothetical protein